MELIREPKKTDLAVQDWGLIQYEEALKRQLDLVELVRQELARDTLVFCTHPPVVTLGRGTLPGDVFGWKGETVEVNRGGRATYHGPSQIVVYPIFDLNLRQRDLHQYMRHLEDAIVMTLQDFGITASGRSIQGEGEVEATGVWIERRKLASIGIGVRKWVSFHGLALNVHQDATAFQGLKPCGFNTETMVSMEEILGASVDRSLVQASLLRSLKNTFEGL